MRNKKMYLIAGIILMSGLVVFIFFKSPKAYGIQQNELSKRALEFIDTQKSKEDSIWSNKNLNEKEDTKGTIFETNCFRLSIPFENSLTKTEEKQESCSFEAQIQNPLARLVVIVEKNKQSIDEHPSVIMRRRDKSTYKEVQKTLDSIPLFIFESKDTLNIFYIQKSKVVTITFTSLTDPKDIKDDVIEKTISSLTVF